MARMAEAAWQGEHGSRPMENYDIVCAHTIVGHDPAHAAHFSTGNDGLISQSRDTKFQSAANLEGNPRVIAIENEDTPPGWSNDLDFTKAQIESIAKIIVWCHKTHGIPIVPCPDSKPGSRGIAYHRQGIDGNFGPFEYDGRVPGGEQWSTSKGKMCPGDRRIKTLLEVIIPRARVLAGLDNPEEDMPLDAEDIQKISATVRAELNRGTSQGQADWADTMKDLLPTLQGHTNKLNTMDGKLNSIIAKIDALPVSGGEGGAPAVVDLAAVKAVVKEALREGTGV
jgi:hypothetical protein